MCLFTPQISWNTITPARTSPADAGFAVYASNEVPSPASSRTHSC